MKDSFGGNGIPVKSICDFYLRKAGKGGGGETEKEEGRKQCLKC